MNTVSGVDPKTVQPESSSPERLDRIFSLLQNHRRRLVLEYLRTHDSTTQGDLARHIASIENGVPEDAVTSTQRKRVYISLHQTHLPKLDDADAISFDQDRGTVERAPETDELLAYLARFERSAPDPGPSTADETALRRGTLLLAVALGAVFAGELGMFPAGTALGLAVLLSVGGVGAVVYGTCR